MILAFLDWPIYKKFASLKQEAEANKQGASSTKRDNEESNLSEDPKIILDKSLPLKGKRQLETEEEEEFNEPTITLITEKGPSDRKQEDKKEEGGKENINTEETTKAPDNKNKNEKSNSS